MKTSMILISAAAVLASSAAFASGAGFYSDSVTGKVMVDQPRCVRAPCPQIVKIVSGDKSVSIPWGSKIADDLAAFDGKTVTVNGKYEGSGADKSFKPSAFMPGKSSDFVTGTLSTRCMNGAATCRAFINVDGTTFPIKDDFKKFAGLDGATVTLPGKLHSNCPVNARCIINFSEFIPSGKNIMVKGNIGMLMRVTNPMIPHAGNYLLKISDDKSVVVDFKGNLMDRNYQDVWVTGHMNAGGGDLAPYFTATKVSNGVSDNSSDELTGGNNAGRNDNTRVTAPATSESNSTGAGVKH